MYECTLNEEMNIYVSDVMKEENDRLSFSNLQFISRFLSLSLSLSFSLFKENVQLVELKMKTNIRIGRGRRRIIDDRSLVWRKYQLRRRKIIVGMKSLKTADEKKTTKTKDDERMLTTRAIRVFFSLVSHINFVVVRLMIFLLYEIIVVVFLF